ncbi:MAG TPA: hypothetical protein VML55_08735 [Planctomycetaceae bacterium]|nr:hypothetical protein [Planctomycetaceae bacterium]
MRYYFLGLGTLVIVCVGCVLDGDRIDDRNAFHAPPAAMLERPGPMVDGPGPGVLPIAGPGGMPGGMPGVVPAGYTSGAPGRAMPGAGGPCGPYGAGAFAGAYGAGEFGSASFAGLGVTPPVLPARTSQVRFLNPPGMQIGWHVGSGFAEGQLTAPGRYDFPQAATYRLKLTNLPDREGVVLYPTLQVYPTHPTTEAYLAHNSIPIELTDADLDQVETNNFVTKVIYLPDPLHQGLAIAGVHTIVSTRLEPGVDPVAEADRRGTILAVLRVGNMDLEMPGAAGAAPFAPGDAGVGVQRGGIQQVAYNADGTAGGFAAPVPIAVSAAGPWGPPPAMVVGQSGIPGMPAMHPVAGMGPIPSWGMPRTGTPIGLPGPTHIPYGKPAGLKSHTMRNLTDVDLGKPVDHMLIDVKHEPGLSLPKPVKHVKYEEEHPSYGEGVPSYPQWYGN